MPVDAVGFLDGGVSVRTALEDAQPGDLLSLRAAAEAQALVVLGEPGLGKSTALRVIADDLRADGAEVVWLDGANVSEETFADELGTHLGRLPLGDAPDVTASEGLTVVLDALDESAIVRRVPRRLLRALTGRDLSSFRLIVGCRTADVPDDLAGILERLFGEGVVFADLAPLRRGDAVDLASSLGADGEQLAAAAVRLGAGSLAAIPLTLGLLAREFLENGVLDVSARELFARGVTMLLDTTDTAASGDVLSTIDQRRAVAERIAAVMLLSGKRTVFVGRELDVGKQDLRASDVSDGFERTASGVFSVTPALVRETLATALFGGRGSDRLAFVHASQAAFLAAGYLRRHEPSVPRRQLEGLLLVAAPDGSRTIPIPLREVAAWLASFDPSVGEWLAATDPESLLGHESYLESDELRATVAASLLARAAELGDRSWRRGIDLAHPGLAAQVLAVLNEVDAQPPDWSDFARCRVALRLAANATSPDLTDRLLQIAESSAWNSHLGSLAAEAALRGDAATAAPGLLQLLRALDEAEFAHARDPDDELRGHLLDGLWPQHIDTADVLPALKPRQIALFGAYWAFLRKFPTHLAGADLVAAIRWAADRTQQEEAAPSTSGDDTDLLHDELPIGDLDALLAEGLVERALGSAQATELMGLAAALSWPRLDRLDRPAIPSSLDEATTFGSTAQVRRDFAEALLRHKAGAGIDLPVDVFHLVRGWRAHGLPRSDGDSAPRSLLLDAADFAWAVERAKDLEHVEPVLAGAMAQLAGYLFNPHDGTAVEVASQQQSTIVWEHLAHWFDPVDLNSELATRLREQHGWTHAHENPDEETAIAAGAFREELLRHFSAVVNGDWTQFWRLAWSLQFHPDNARGGRLPGDRLLDFPAMSVLPSDAPAQLISCAREFLLNEHDHADEWLGTTTFDKRAWAGYLALALLDEADELESVPLPRMASWAGAILWFWSVPSETGDPKRKGHLITRAMAADAARVAALLPRYVRGDVRRGGLASEVDAFDPASIRAIQSTWTDMVAELHSALIAPGEIPESESGLGPLTGFPSDEARGTARYAWQRMLRGLALADPVAAEILASAWATADGDATANSVAASSIAVLLSIEPAAWRRLAGVVQADDDLARQVAAAIVDDHHDVRLLANLGERELRDLYVWLATIYPPEADEPEHLGAGWVTPAAQAQRWRDNVLTAIANRGTEDAVRVLSGLHQQFPARIIVLSNLVRARVATFATAWQPPEAAEVQSLLEDARRRLVRSGEELALLIQEALRAVEVDLVRTGQLLWDRLPKVEGAPRPWNPKPEAALSAFLAHDLQLRLQDRGVAVHREVLVKPTDAYGAGDRPDILVEARTDSEHVGNSLVHRVAIEVKGAWNADVLTAQSDQLALRYLPEAETGVGLYVVGWYPIDLWDTTDYRRARAAKTTSTELLDTLSSQADEINKTTSFTVTPIVLAIPRPAPNGPADAG